MSATSEGARAMAARSAEVRRANRDARQLDAAVRLVVDRAPALNDQQTATLRSIFGGAR